MKKIVFALIFSVILTMCTQVTVYAQTSIIPEISDVYLTKLFETARLHANGYKSIGSRIKIAEGNVTKAKISYLDEFTISYVYTPHADNGGGVVATNPVSTTTIPTTTVGSNYNYFNSIQIGFFFNPANFFIKPVNVKSANEELKIVRNDQAEYLITLRSNIKKLYYTYLQRQADLRIAIQNSALDDQTLAIVKRRFEKGEETFEAYNKATAGASANVTSRIGAEVAYLLAKSDLEAVLGEKIENIK